MLRVEALQGLKAVIIGVAREGVALARFLCHYGADVILSDLKPAEMLAEQLQKIRGLPLHLVLGGNPLELLEGIDVLFVSPGVPPSAPIIQEARRRGIPISSEPRLFTQLCPVPIVGITGSSGKTTTTSLVGEMFRAAGKDVWVGGNIGKPLLERVLDEPYPSVAVMELSSFQLELFSPDYQGADVRTCRSERSRVVSLEGWSPHIAAITNITPNHLDRHLTMENYVRAKRNILAFQKEDAWAILNTDDPRTWALSAEVKGGLLGFGLQNARDQGAFLRGGALKVRYGGREQVLCQRREIKLRGQHNVANILAATCCALAAGLDIESIREVATSFSGVPHRLEPVRRWRGVLFINDSIATSPERAMAALRSFSEPLVLLAGGRDKHLPWDEWAELVWERVRVVVAFGEAVPIIEKALAQVAEQRKGISQGPQFYQVETLEEAVRLAAREAKPGEVVLLSPGGTSFDAFENFEERGRAFRALVAAL